MNNARKNERLGFFSTLASVASSFLGVQSEENRERDFQRGRARDFILIGILLTMVFIASIYGVVQLVMSVAKPN